MPSDSTVYRFPSFGFVFGISIVFIYVISSLILAALLAILKYLNVYDQAIEYFALRIINYLMLVLTPVFCYYFARENFPQSSVITFLKANFQLTSAFRGKIKIIQITFLCTVIIISFAIIIAIILAKILLLMSLGDILQNNSNYIPPVFISYFFTVCFSPFLEELIFRGFILQGFLTRYPIKKSIIYSAILFSIAHLNVFQVIPSFLVGIFIGRVYCKTKSLAICIFCHTLFNFILSSPLLENVVSLLTKLDTSNPLIALANIPVLTIMPFCLVLAIGIFALEYSFKQVEMRGKAYGV